MMGDSYVPIIPKRLSLARLDLNLSIKSAAYLTGISIANLEKYELGLLKVPLSDGRRICLYYKTSFNELYKAFDKKQ